MKRLQIALLAIFALCSCCRWSESANLALNHVCTASSSYDYSLTAQLATDGIKDDRPVQYMTLVCSQGEVPRSEREKLFDQNTSTQLKYRSCNVSVELGFHNYSVDFDNILVTARMWNEERKDVNWQVIFEASDDGDTWVEMDRCKGRSQRIFETMTKKGQWQNYRLSFSSDTQVEWTLCDWEFYKGVKNFEIPPLRSPSGHPRSDMLAVLPGFVSVWMSPEGISGKEAQKQWIMVDLGEECKVQKALLYWDGNIPSGMVQTSLDGKKWKNVSAIDSEVALRGKARFVRLALEAGQKAVLREFEVVGQRPVKKEGSSESDCGALQWEVCREGNEGNPGAWIKATVPGTVLVSYIDNGILPDPNYADNQLQISESFFKSNFIYRTAFEFKRSELQTQKKLLLNFDGVSWKAAVFLNGEGIGSVEGIFKRATFDISDKILDGRNELVVKVITVEHPGVIKEQNRISSDINGGVLGLDNPSFHASIGWDWIPTIRGRNVGLWNDVYLTVESGVRVTDPLVQTKVNACENGSYDAEVAISAIVENRSEKTLNAMLKAVLRAHDGTEYEAQCPVSVNGEDRAEFTMDRIAVRDAQLWWPNGYGEAYLYDCSITVTDEGGQVLCSKDFKAGLREMTYTADEGIVQLYVNGRRFIGRGGNWGMTESNLRYTEREYDIAVKYHRDMNFTMIRNWVCQTGDDEFFEACDRYGIMIWQDFWLANPWDGPDPKDETLFMENAKDFIGRIRRHPSIALYCGRNEGMPPANLDTALSGLVRSRHADIIYIPHSADHGVSGYGPYNALDTKEYFTLKGADRMHSERGMPAPMNYESLARTLPEDKMWPQNDIWGMHDFTEGGAQKCTTFNTLVEQAFGHSDNAREWCKRAQWVTYNGYRAMFEGRGPKRQGLLLWMTHCAWPSMVWQTYDYYFDPTAAYFGCKKACEPLHIQFNPVTSKVEVVNYSAGEHPKLKAAVSVYDARGGLMSMDEYTVCSMEDSTVEVGEYTYGGSHGCNPGSVQALQFMKLRLYENNEVVSENVYCLGDVNGALAGLECGIDARVKVEMSSDTQLCDDEYRCSVKVKNISGSPAIMVHLQLRDRRGERILPAIFEDNYLCLMPDEERILRLIWPSEHGAKGLNVTVD